MKVREFASVTVKTVPATTERAVVTNVTLPATLLPMIVGLEAPVPKAAPRTTEGALPVEIRLEVTGTLDTKLTNTFRSGYGLRR